MWEARWMPRLPWMADARSDERAALARAAEPARAVGQESAVRVWRRPQAVFAAAVAVEAAIALPFSPADPASVRGIPAPLMLVVAVLGAFVVGLRLGVVLAVIASVLAVGIVGEQAVSAPVWIGVSALVGFAGDRFRRAEADNRRLQYELQSNLLPPAASLERTPLMIARRYKPAEQRLLLGG